MSSGDDTEQTEANALLFIGLATAGAAIFASSGLDILAVAVPMILGPKNLQTTLRYAEQSDAMADTELRAWPRKQRRSC